MTSTPTPVLGTASSRAATARADHPGSRAASLRSWRSAVSVASMAGGIVMIIGCLLPWASAYAGLVTFAGIGGSNGRLLAAAGAAIVLAGLAHLIRGGSRSRWLAGLAGFAAAGYSGLLLLRLAGSLRSLGPDSMVILRAGPGLWVIAAGALLAFSTLFLPSSEQRTLRAGAREGGGLRTRAADLDSSGGRRRLQIGLGLLWLLDAALQYQPFMFGRGFVTQIVDPSTMGSPAIVANSVTSTGQLLLSHAVAFNAAFATIQLALGAGLIWRRTARAALAGTMIWAIAVWWFGESFGMLLSGTASPLTGAPGAAVLYLLIAALAWPRPGSGAAQRPWARLIWLAVWGGFAALMFQPQVRAPGALSSAVGGMAANEPGWLAAIDRAVAGFLASGGLVPAMIFAVAFAVIAAGLFFSATARPALILAAVAALAIWVLGENLGGILTGSGTDPNSGLLLLLLISAFWPSRLADQEVGAAELARAPAELEGEARPEREVAALAVQVPAGAAGAPDRLR